MKSSFRISKENDTGIAFCGGLGERRDVEVGRRDFLLKCFEAVLHVACDNPDTAK